MAMGHLCLTESHLVFFYRKYQFLFLKHQFTSATMDVEVTLAYYWENYILMCFFKLNALLIIWWAVVYGFDLQFQTDMFIFRHG